MSGRGIAAAVLLALAGCEPPPARLPPAVTAEEKEPEPLPQVTARSGYHIAQPLYELVDSADRVERRREQAIGVVVPVYGEAAPQELSVVNDTAYEIRTMARLRFYPRAEGGWTDTLWTREADLYGGLVRATHEDYGLPVTAVRGRWLRVDFAFDSLGAPRSGWVQLVPGKSVYHDRDQQMSEFSTSLVDPQGTTYYESPQGAEVQPAVGASHTLKVLQIRGDWIRVLIMQPDTSACSGDESVPVRQRDTVWVRRFNAQGKRQLTSAIAGC
jgi:hypothetical protein